jgi:hypothetical protein
LSGPFPAQCGENQEVRELKDILLGYYDYIFITLNPLTCDNDFKIATWNAMPHYIML